MLYLCEVVGLQLSSVMEIETERSELTQCSKLQVVDSSKTSKIRQKASRTLSYSFSWLSEV